MPVTYASKFDFYVDGSVCYLQLHALRAPVGHYKAEYADSSDLYEYEVMRAIEDFQDVNSVEVYQLGRSGRHICIEDTPRNRRRYASLQRKAIAAAKAMWAEMRSKS